MAYSIKLIDFPHQCKKMRKRMKVVTNKNEENTIFYFKLMTPQLMTAIGQYQDIKNIIFILTGHLRYSVNTKLQLMLSLKWT